MHQPTNKPTHRPATAPARRLARLAACYALLAAATPAWGQRVVKAGQGSYASYPPLIVSRSTQHIPDAWGNTGDQSQMMQYRKLYVEEQPGRPIPTNDWWTNLITETYSGKLWSYPQMVQAKAEGIDIQHPTFWIDNGTEMKSNTVLTVSGKRFAPTAAIATDWHDWDVAFAMTDGSRRMAVTMAHGMPFTWIEMQDIEPLVTLTNTSWTDATYDTGSPVEVLDTDGNTLPSTSVQDALVMRKGGDAYGLFLPPQTTVTIDGSRVSLRFAGTAAYIIVGCINQVADMAALKPYAYSVPRNTQVSWQYDASASKVRTVWDVTAESLNGGTAMVMQGFLPHHYRDTGNPSRLPFAPLEYATPHGKLRMATGNRFEIDYNFYGMMPYYALPTDTLGNNPFSRERMQQMLNDYADNGTFGNDTYWGGKGLTQMALYMTFAREMGDSARFVQCRDRLKEALVDWYTFTPGEKTRFFARYDRWGGMVGYATSYDSDTFNDHHFHYGYFALASALLALVDDDFRDNYGEMARLLVKDYANWDRTDTAYPFLRTFDPWAGHSFAGGMGDGNGNGQESSSEAMQAWGGMYLLGVALDDKEMRDAGLFGWVSEARGTAEYWFDRHSDPEADYTIANYHRHTDDNYNIPYSRFTSTYTQDGVEKRITPPYNSNLTCHGVGWWTYFGWDAIFMQGIQWMPISPALDYLSENKAFAAWDYARLMQDKLIGGWHADSKTAAGYLGDSGGWGNVALSYLQRSDPDEAARIFDECWTQGDKEFTTFGTNGITYFVTHAHRSHGDLSWEVTADSPTARAFDKDGKRTYQVYNPSDTPLTVRFSDGYSATVAPHELFVSDAPDRKALRKLPPTPSTANVLDTLGMENLALHKPCEASGYENAGTVVANATDGDDGSRWGSRHQDGEWISVDMQEMASLYKLRLHWEAAYASTYTIMLSADGADWHKATTIASDGGWDEIKMHDAQARYIKIVGDSRATPYGISLYEIEAYGQKQSLGPNDIIGIKIAADLDVLKQHAPSQLTAKGYTVAGQWVEMQVDWATTDGSITPQGVFTPSVFDMATVKASTPTFSIEKRFAVEEAIVMTSLKATPQSDILLVGDDALPFELTATDQFGGPIDLTSRSVTASAWAVADDGTLTATPDATCDTDLGQIEATRPGTYAIIVACEAMRDTMLVQAKAFGDYNLALGKPTEATSAKDASMATLATDGNTSSRWESQWDNTTDQLTVDLEALYRLDRVRIMWENAAARNYDIQVSADGMSFTTCATDGVQGGGWKTTALTWPDGTLPEARYVRISCNEKLMPAYGYSLFELEVYGTEKVKGLTTQLDTVVSATSKPPMVYDLTGRCLGAKNPELLPRGIYIISGRKYVKH